MESTNPAGPDQQGARGPAGVASGTTGSASRRACSSSRSGKVMLSCWIPAAQRLELDHLWASQGLRPHGRTQQGMEAMIAAYLQSQRGQ
jgi:hypothetical protein